MDLPDPTLLAIPAFIVTMLAEAWLGQRSGRVRYTGGDTFTSLALGIGSVLAGLITGGAVLAMANAVYAYRLFDIGYVWWAWPLAFVLDDLAYYWFHRTAHRVRWFWAAHVVHHSSEHYNLSTALRQTWTGFIALSFLFRLPLFLLGFPPALVFFLVGLNLIYQYWIHTEAVGRMPRWFEAVMNTPSHHRVHHATNPRYLDANFAGVFIVWDRMFGTFVPEDEQDPIRYGIVKPLERTGGIAGVLWAAFHEWVGIAQDMWRAPWRAKLGYLLRPPGWSHDGSRETSDMIRARWQAGHEAER
ncbi:MAG: C-5 sterol desaturase [Sphingomonadales bacterium 32-64-17]|nr:MAG: C-5 sterol desaturase [Sphingomonadales bacterium 32-64-17]